LASQDYLRGFEDAIELALYRVSKAESLRHAREELERIWSQVKERKLDAIERALDDLR